ncbi:MAG: hypothetical protein ACLGJC_05715 [Alphaproteobacteria bacterium]
MTAMFSTVASAGTLPPRPVTIHKEGACTVAFEDFGSVSVTGPRRAELAGMISALPVVLRALASITTVLRERDGAASPHVAALEEALTEAGINPFATLEEAQPMTPVTPSSPMERYAALLGTIADRLDALLADKKGMYSTPTPVRDALADISTTIRRTLRENGTDAAQEGGAE